MNDAVDQHTQTNVENADPVPATETRVDLLKSATSGSSMDDFAPWLEDGDKATTQAEVDSGGIRDESKWGVKRQGTGTPHRHPIGTPFRRWFRLVPVANRRGPRGA